MLRTSGPDGQGQFSLDFVKKIPATAIPAPVFCANATPAKITVDLDGAGGIDRLYVALGCNGLVVYNIEDPFDPQVESYNPTPGAFHALRGPATQGVHRLYVTYMNEGVRIFNDLTDVGNSAWSLYDAPFQVGGMAYGNSIDEIFVANTRSGLFHMSFSFAP